MAVTVNPGDEAVGSEQGHGPQRGDITGVRVTYGHVPVPMPATAGSPITWDGRWKQAHTSAASTAASAFHRSRRSRPGAGERRLRASTAAGSNAILIPSIAAGGRAARPKPAAPPSARQGGTPPTRDARPRRPRCRERRPPREQQPERRLPAEHGTAASNESR